MSKTMSKIITIEVSRYRPEIDAKPWLQSFQVEWTQDMSVLDALAQIKDEQAPELAYRWSCRMEVCGSCGMVINGEPKLACSTFVRDFADCDKITVEPLNHFPIEKDLIVDIEPFIEKLNAVKPYIIKEKPVTEFTDVTQAALTAHTQTPAELAKFKQYTMCINCMLCYQACPQVAINAEFLGPAANALAFRYNNDSRDEGAAQRFAIQNLDTGVWPCTFVGYCSEVCPKNVDPAGAIQQTKAQGAPYWLKSFFNSDADSDVHSDKQGEQ